MQNPSLLKDVTSLEELKDRGNAAMREGHDLVRALRQHAGMLKRTGRGRVHETRMRPDRT